MKLRRLSLSGFKTFARRSEIVFDRGITAVVGPNGSGKSNIVDAVRWALGETNARELRGARMDEVIYSGGNRKGRMNVAEVELVLDNEDGRIPIEGSEVAVGRRVTRNGDSEFRLNGDRVRLRDVDRVLGATGLTQTGYSVVAQNDIDGIIQATPAQRRALVEQAAGVRSLRAASEDALDKIGKAEFTLRRLDDILDEAEPRLAELAVQAELALEQRELAERLAELRGSLAREEWRAARGQLRQARRRLDGALSRAEAAAVAETAFDARFEEQRSLVALARETHRNAVARLEAARLAAERAAGDARRWFDRQSGAVLQRAAARAELGLAIADREAADAALTALAASGADTQAQAGVAEAAVQTARERHEAALSRARESEMRVAAAEAEMQRTNQAWERAAAAQRDAAARVEVLTESLNALAGEVAAIRDRVVALDAEHVALVSRVEATAAAQAIAEASAARATEICAGLRARLRDAEHRVAELRDVAQATVARAALLRGQMDGALGGRGAVADAVDSGRIEAVRLVECFRVSGDADAAAVEAALEDHLGAWIVADLDAAATLLESGAGREEVIAADSTALPRSPAPAGTRRALDSVELLRESARGPLEHLLGDVWLAPDAPTARRAVADMGGRAVLADGRVFATVGVRGGGRPGETLVLAAEEREAGLAAQAALTAERAALDEVRAINTELTGADERAALAAAEVQQARVNAAETAALAASTASARDGERRRLSGTEESQRARAEEVAVLEETMRGAAGIAADAGAARQAAAVDLERIRTEIADQRAVSEAAATAMREAEALAVEARLLSNDLVRRTDAARAAHDAALSRIRHAEIRVLACETEAMNALVRSRRARSAAAGVGGDVDIALAALDVAAPSLGEAERILAQVEAERSEIAIAVARAADERAAAETEVAAAQARVDELADVVRDDDADEGPEPDAQAAEKAEREIVRLERRIAGMGPVNGLAPEQHESLAVRVTTVRTARDDIGVASADVRAMVAQLGVEIENRFDAVFGAVCVHFQELFGELFPGGRATLRLEEPTAAPAAAADAETAPAELAEPGTTRAQRAPRLPGVEILAQPAGKRLQPLSLLSGGERALTALAVILALQQVNASPFYIFDEIDAPLDDANVVRLSRLLTRLSQEQQFIVVTHNHVTMAAADVLYGVTIDGEGVSSVLSVRLATAEEMTEVPVTGRVETNDGRAVAGAAR